MLRPLTVEEAEQAGLFELYEFSPEGEKMPTRDGELPLREWLEQNKQRIEGNPLRRAAVVRLKYNSNMLALFVNAPAVWESEARALGYHPITDWSTPDQKLAELGYTEPRPIIRNKYERAAADDQHIMIVRQDKGDRFAVFARDAMAPPSPISS